MQNPMECAFTYAAESNNSASWNMSAAFDAYFAKILTAIMIMMAVVLFAAVDHLPVLDILITGILGVILIIVRGEE